MVLRMLVLLLLLVRHVVDAHIAVIAASLSISHGSGGEVGRRHHDWSRHALLPYLTGAALLCLKKKKKVITSTTLFCFFSSFIFIVYNINDIRMHTLDQYQHV